METEQGEGIANEYLHEVTSRMKLYASPLLNGNMLMRTFLIDKQNEWIKYLLNLRRRSQHPYQGETPMHNKSIRWGTKLADFTKEISKWLVVTVINEISQFIFHNNQSKRKKKKKPV